MRDILPDVSAWLAQNERIALATVIQTWGSAPRRVGANMGMTASAKLAGSVSGGCVEGAVIEAGLDCLRTGKSQLLHFGVADETAWQVGLACGGTIEVYVKELDRSAFGILASGLTAGTPLIRGFAVRGQQRLLSSECIACEWPSRH